VLDMLRVTSAWESRPERGKGRPTTGDGHGHTVDSYTLAQADSNKMAGENAFQVTDLPP